MIAQLQKHVRLWFLTAIALLAVVPPAIARDFTYEYAGQTLTYTVLSEEDKTCETKAGYTPSAGNPVSGAVVIPETVSDGTDTYTVIQIGVYAFYGCSDLTSITIPNSITTIGNLAFNGCSGLSSITIPSSITTIGESAFYGCSGLSSIEIPNSVTEIGNYVFSNCHGLISVIYNSDALGEGLFQNSPVRDLTFGGTTASNIGIQGLKNITFTNNVTSIGDYAFSSCSELISVEIPESVTIIGEGAFARCIRLTSIQIPNSVTSIGNSVFSNCSNLTSVEIPNSVTAIGNRTFEQCSKLTFVEIPNSITSIGEFAFQSCSELTTVEIPNSVTSIGNGAFHYCSRLISMEIPNSVTTVGHSVFNDCSNLTKVVYNSDAAPASVLFYNSPITDFTFGGTTVPENMAALFGIKGLKSLTITDNVTSIGYRAFAGCTGLTYVEIPYSVTTIKHGVFSGCSNLTKVVYNSDAIPSPSLGDSFDGCPITNFTFGGTTVPKDMAALFGIKGLENLTLTLTDNVTKINDLAFNECAGLISVKISNSVSTISRNSFSGCTGLTSIEIPNSVITIGDYAFSGCTGLTTATLSDSVEEIGGHAFSDCSGLISVKIPNSVTTIDSGVFSGCTGLTSIEIPNSVTTIDYGAFSGCTGLTSVKLPDSVEKIGVYAFSDCTGLKSVQFSDSMTTILGNAFSGCTSLTSIEIPNSVTAIGNHTFSNCTALTSVVYNSNAYHNYIFQNAPIIDFTFGGTTVPDEMTEYFGIKGLKRLTLTDNVTVIGKYAFNSCVGLTSIEIPNSVTTIGEDAFYGCTGLTSIEIPSSITTIGKSAFDCCSGLTSVVYNSDAYAMDIFRRCSISDFTFGGSAVPESMASIFGILDLQRLTLTDNVTSIGKEAFRGCSGINSIEIPNSVTTIGEQAFAGCGNIETITFASVTPPEANQNEFSELWRSARIVVPGDALTTYLDFAPYNRFYKWGTVEEPEGHSDGVFAYVFTENPPAAYIMADESYREAGPALTVPLRTNKGTTIYPIKGILPGAFHYCTNLNSVKIGNNVELIGYNAFASCNALTSVEIPNSVITIGGGAFNGCSGLTSIEIPNSVTTIGDTAFSNCYGLTSLEIPNSVATIGYGAFMGNYKVSELTLGSGLKTIGVAAFQGCARITDVVIPPFVTEIGASAFAGTGLKTVKIGCRVTSIGANAFAQMNDMTGIYVTAMAPPTAENTSFNNYSMPLYVVPGTISLYENASPCWYRFYDEGSISEQTPVTEVTVEDMLLAGANPGDTFQIKSGVVPAEATLPHLFYVSSNPDVVQVTHEGLVTIMEPQATNDEEIETYSYREPADVEIRVYSMYDDVAPAVIKFDISTGVDDIVIGDASGEIDRSLPYEVYNLNGQMVGTDRSNLANGIYIVRQGSKVQKIAVK